MINLNVPAATPKTPVTGQTAAGLGGDIVPKGFALLAQSKTSTLVPALPGDAATAERTGSSTVLIDVSLAVEDLATSLVQDTNVNQTALIVVTQPVVSGPLLQQPGLANGQQSTAVTIGPALVAAQVVPDGKSIGVLTPSVTLVGNPVQTAAAVPTQIGELMAEPSKLAVPVPENSNQSPQKFTDVEVTEKLPASAKALQDSDTAKPVAATKSAESALVRTLTPRQEGQRVNAANVNSTTKPTGTADALQGVTKGPQTANVDTKRPADQAQLVTATAMGVVKPAGEDVDGQGAEPVIQDQRTAERPAALVGIGAKSAVSAGLARQVRGVFNPANGVSDLLGLSDRAGTEPVSVLAPGIFTTASKTAAPLDASLKVAPKPFAEALMAQVKSVDASEGRTTVNLLPRGLGNIEVEVISEKDVASKVVVRVENLAVLQALRDDRHLLAQAIGVSDSSIFDFQEYGPEDQSDPQDKQGGQSGDPLGDTTATQSHPQHLDVVHEGQLDILT